jgi:nitrite reductase/ring-hydroxylating ferredoxin subunit
VGSHAQVAACRSYNFWSGIGSDITEFAVLGWLYAFLRKHNCHAKGCPRIGRHAVSGTDYVVCRKHHPDDSPTAGQIRLEANG